ncbi:NAD(P)-dependent alcohol dehydrogenase [Aquimarina sp. 2201CG1-2-11]|uniref:NAD(P)-dependent alcohol dehydrogenase n=1 Tax=Aquimarina discodermiae TaxID=3231043 RepID=UPI003462F3E0
MRAIIYTRYGPPEVLRLSEVEQPVPKDDQVLIKIHAVAVNTGDCELRSPKIPNTIWLIVRLYFGLLKPRKKILGAYLSGEVVQTGKLVKRFKKGDSIFACSGPVFGGYAEYICLNEEKAIAIKPTNLSFEEAATIPLGLDALHFLRKINIQKGQKVLINGAGGGIGTIAVQLAKHFGAEVTAVDSTQKLNMLESIGADYTIDYTKEDFAKKNKTYDIIFDLIGKRAYNRCIRSLKTNGYYLLANPDGLSQMLRGVWTSLVTNKKVISQFADAKHEDLVFLKELIEERKLKAVIDKTYSLDQVVAAHKYVESGQKKGNVVLSLRE